jgi:hypothetical protein
MIHGRYISAELPTNKSIISLAASLSFSAGTSSRQGYENAPTPFGYLSPSRPVGMIDVRAEVSTAWTGVLLMFS